MIDVMKTERKRSKQEKNNCHFNTWKKNDGMKETVFGKQLEARMNNS